MVQLVHRIALFGIFLILTGCGGKDSSPQPTGGTPPTASQPKTKTSSTPNQPVKLPRESTEPITPALASMLTNGFDNHWFNENQRRFVVKKEDYRRKTGEKTQWGIQIYDVEQSAFLPNRLTIESRVVYVKAFDAEGKRLITGGEHVAQVWNVATGKLLYPPLDSKERAVQICQFSLDGKKILTCSKKENIYLWDAATGKPFGMPLKHSSTVECATFSPDSKYVLGGTYEKVVIWEVKTGKVVDELPQDRWAQDISFSPDGTKVVIASGGQTAESQAQVWDFAQRKKIGEPMPHEKGIYSVLFSPDGQYIGTASRDSTARIWDAKTGKPITRPIEHKSSPLFTTFSPDSKFFATGGYNHEVVIRDCHTGEAISRPMKYEERSLSLLVFSSDAKYLYVHASGYGDEKVYQWEVKSGKKIREFTVKFD